MKLAIFGASGKTGLHLVSQALEMGHEVTVLARRPSKVTLSHTRLMTIQGNILDAGSVEATIQGSDAVVSALGPIGNTPELQISQGMSHILSVMKKHNVRRLIVAAGAGIRDPQDKPKLIDHVFGLLLHLLSKHAVKDMERTIDLVRQSDRDWTVVRVPRLNDNPTQDKLRVGYLQDITTNLSRADMAAFMLSQLTNTAYIRQAPAISN
jgi:putative NADH-flavin reductase